MLRGFERTRNLRSSYEECHTEIGNSHLNSTSSVKYRELALAHDQLLPPPMDTITYRAYSGEHELPHIISLVQSELSEPYVVYTYRYFLHQWSVPLSLYPASAPH